MTKSSPKNKIKENDSTASETGERTITKVEDFTVNTSNTREYSNHYLVHRYLPKFMWTIFVLGACIGFGINFYFLIIRYQSVPVSTVYEQRSEAFVWPDITICSSSYAYIQKVLLSNFKERTMFMDYYLALGEFYVKKKTLKHFNFGKWRLFNTIIKFPTLLASGFEVVLGCKFKGQACSFLNFTTHRNPARLNCFTFKSRDRSPGLPGPTFGLNLILDLMISDDNMNYKNKVPENFNGFTVAIHAPDTLPNLEKDFIDVGVGYSLDIEVKAKRIYKLNRSSNPCSSHVMDSTVGFPGYLSSIVSCQDTSIQKTFINRCACQAPYRYKIFDKTATNGTVNYTRGCLDLALNIPANVTYNKGKVSEFWKNLYCYMNISELSILMDTVCPTFCNDTKYSISSSSKRWPGFFKGFNKQLIEAILNNIALLKQLEINTLLYNVTFKDDFIWYVENKNRSDKEKLLYLRQRFSFVRIYLGDTRMDVTREEAAYTRVNLLSDIGGLMGMWIGVSFIAIYNIVEIVLTPLVQCAIQLFTKRHDV